MVWLVQLVDWSSFKNIDYILGLGHFVALFSLAHLVSNRSQNMCYSGTCLIWFMYLKTFKSFDLTQMDAKTLTMSLTFILEIYL